MSRFLDDRSVAQARDGLLGKLERITTMKCCGFDIKTSFCPSCGKESKVRTPLEQVLGFFKLRLKAAKKKKVDQKKWLKSDRPNRRTESEQKRLQRTQDAAIEQWARWAGAVEKAIRAESTKKVRR